MKPGQAPLLERNRERAALLREAAHLYAGAGFRVFPVFEMAHDNAMRRAGLPRCTCSARADCGSPGKHPANGAGGHNLASRSARFIDWHWQTPRNIGLRPPTGWAFLDVDPRNGGDESWARSQASEKAVF